MISTPRKIDDEYIDDDADGPPFGGDAPASAPVPPSPATPPAKPASAASLDRLAGEVRALTTALSASQAQLAGDIVAAHAAIESLPAALGQVAQDAATQQGARTTEQVGKVKSDIGQVLAAISTQNALAPPTPNGTSKAKVRLGWLSVAAMVGCGSSAMATGVVLAAILGIGQPLPPGPDRQMATYVWLTQGDTLRACLDQLQRTGRGVQCPLVFSSTR